MWSRLYRNRGSFLSSPIRVLTVCYSSPKFMSLYFCLNYLICYYANVKKDCLCCQHTIKRMNGSLEALKTYRANLTVLIPYMKEVVLKDTKIYWMLQGTNHNRLC